jgi:hypothetical protein
MYIISWIPIFERNGDFDEQIDHLASLLKDPEFRIGLVVDGSANELGVGNKRKFMADVGTPKLELFTESLQPLRNDFRH